MNTKTKSHFKILGWAIVALSLVLMINYFMYDVSFANQRIVNVPGRGGESTFYDDTYWLDNNEVAYEDCFGNESNIDLVLDANHLTSNVSVTGLQSNDKYGLINYKYKIQDIYMDFAAPNKVRVNYRTWNDDLDDHVNYTFRLHFDVYNKDGGFIGGQGDWTEWRRDGSDNDHKYDHETFDSTDSSDFQDEDGHYSEGCWLPGGSITLRSYLIAKLVWFGGFENPDSLWDLSLQDLVSKGYVKITMTAVRIDM